MSPGCFYGKVLLRNGRSLERALHCPRRTAPTPQVPARQAKITMPEVPPDQNFSSLLPPAWQIPSLNLHAHAKGSMDVHDAADFRLEVFEDFIRNCPQCQESRALGASACLNFLGEEAQEGSVPKAVLGCLGTLPFLDSLSLRTP